MTNYFRITGYCPKEDLSFIMDSNGKFEKLWQFSAYIVSKGCKVLEVSTAEKFIDINIEKVGECPDKLILRATASGHPKYIEQSINGITYKALEVKGKVYIPDKNA